MGDEQGEIYEAVEGDKAPEGAEHQADLPRLVDHIQERLVLKPVWPGSEQLVSSHLFIDALVLSNYIRPRFVLSNNRH